MHFKAGGQLPENSNRSSLQFEDQTQEPTLASEATGIPVEPSQNEPQDSLFDRQTYPRPMSNLPPVARPRDSGKSRWSTAWTRLAGQRVSQMGTGEPAPFEKQYESQRARRAREGYHHREVGCFQDGKRGPKRRLI